MVTPLPVIRKGFSLMPWSRRHRMFALEKILLQKGLICTLKRLN